MLVALLAALFGRLQKGSIHNGIIVTAKEASGSESSSEPHRVSRPEGPTKVGDVAFHEIFWSVSGGLDGDLVDVHLVHRVDVVGRENLDLLEDSNLFGSVLNIIAGAQVDLAVIVVQPWWVYLSLASEFVVLCNLDLNVVFVYTCVHLYTA